MAEWLKAVVSKTIVPLTGIRGSNPLFSSKNKKDIGDKI